MTRACGSRRCLTAFLITSICCARSCYGPRSAPTRLFVYWPQSITCLLYAALSKGLRLGFAPPMNLQSRRTLINTKRSCGQWLTITSWTGISGASTRTRTCGSCRIGDVRPLIKLPSPHVLRPFSRNGHGSILSASRRGWVKFTENLLRGYVRLRAESVGVRLALEHEPAPAPKTLTVGRGRVGIDPAFPRRTYPSWGKGR